MIGIIDYGAGNIFSLQSALTRLRVEHRLVSRAEHFDTCHRFIIPGVGHATTAMKRLTETGLIPRIRQTQKPVLGICLGMQLLCEHSEEGDTRMLGLIPLRVCRFRTNLKVPHTGWNFITFQDAAWNGYYYFLHSYFVEESPDYTLGKTEYGSLFSAALRRDNFTGVQFHPEKSAALGQKFLKAWLAS